MRRPAFVRIVNRTMTVLRGRPASEIDALVRPPRSVVTRRPLSVTTVERSVPRLAEALIAEGAAEPAVP